MLFSYPVGMSKGTGRDHDQLASSLQAAEVAQTLASERHTFVTAQLSQQNALLQQNIGALNEKHELLKKENKIRSKSLQEQKDSLERGNADLMTQISSLLQQVYYIESSL